MDEYWKFLPWLHKLWLQIQLETLTHFLVEISWTSDSFVAYWPCSCTLLFVALNAFMIFIIIATTLFLWWQSDQGRLNFILSKSMVSYYIGHNILGGHACMEGIIEAGTVGVWAGFPVTLMRSHIWWPLLQWPVCLMNKCILCLYLSLSGNKA